MPPPRRGRCEGENLVDWGVVSCALEFGETGEPCGTWQVELRTCGVTFRDGISRWEFEGEPRIEPWSQNPETPETPD
jgi:hypothetical protein